MKYIFLVAGKGSRLSPLTSDMPKSMFKLGVDTTLIARMINLIKRHDRDVDIVVVTVQQNMGFLYWLTQHITN